MKKEANNDSYYADEGESTPCSSNESENGGPPKKRKKSTPCSSNESENGGSPKKRKKRMKRRECRTPSDSSDDCILLYLTTPANVEREKKQNMADNTVKRETSTSTPCTRNIFNSLMNKKPVVVLDNSLNNSLIKSEKPLHSFTFNTGCQSSDNEPPSTISSSRNEVDRVHSSPDICTNRNNTSTSHGYIRVVEDIVTVNDPASQPTCSQNTSDSLDSNFDFDNLQVDQSDEDIFSYSQLQEDNDRENDVPCYVKSNSSPSSSLSSAEELEYVVEGEFTKPYILEQPYDNRPSESENDTSGNHVVDNDEISHKDGDMKLTEGSSVRPDENIQSMPGVNHNNETSVEDDDIDSECDKNMQLTEEGVYIMSEDETAPSQPKVDEIAPSKPKVDETAPSQPKVDETAPSQSKVVDEASQFSAGSIDEYIANYDDMLQGGSSATSGDISYKGDGTGSFPRNILTEETSRNKSIDNISDEEVDGAWSCSICTFANHPELWECEMCTTKRGCNKDRDEGSGHSGENNEDVLNTQYSQHDLSESDHDDHDDYVLLSQNYVNIESDDDVILLSDGETDTMPFSIKREHEDEFFDNIERHEASFSATTTRKETSDTLNQMKDLASRNVFTVMEDLSRDAPMNIDTSSIDSKPTSFTLDSVNSLTVETRPNRNQSIEDRAADDVTSDDDLNGGWSCGNCTFSNYSELLECEICFTKKGSIIQSSDGVQQDSKVNDEYKEACKSQYFQHDDLASLSPKTDLHTSSDDDIPLRDVKKNSRMHKSVSLREGNGIDYDKKIENYALAPASPKTEAHVHVHQTSDDDIPIRGIPRSVSMPQGSIDQDKKVEDETKLQQLIEQDRSRRSTVTKECAPEPMIMRQKRLKDAFYPHRRGIKDTPATKSLVSESIYTSTIAKSITEEGVHELPARPVRIEKPKTRHRSRDMDKTYKPSPLNKSMKKARQLMMERSAPARRDNLSVSLHLASSTRGLQATTGLPEHIKPSKSAAGSSKDQPTIKSRPPQSARLCSTSRQDALTKSMLEPVKPVAKNCQNTTVTDQSRKPTLPAQPDSKSGHASSKHGQPQLQKLSTSRSPMPENVNADCRPVKIKPTSTAPNTETTRSITVNDFIETILRWNSSWLKEQESRSDLPPILGQRRAHPLLWSYASLNDYHDVMYPPLLLEVWEQLSKAIKERNPNILRMGVCGTPDDPNIISRSAMITYQCQVLIRSSELERAEFMESDIVYIIETSSSNESKSTTMFGYLEKVTKHHVNNRIKLHPALVDFKQGSGDMIYMLNIKIKKHKLGARLVESSYLIRRLDSLTTSLRQMSALCFLERSPLRRDLLRPTNTQVFGERTQVAKGYYNYNASQLQAISDVSHSAMQPYTLPKISLVQGPPGTGKSHTIVGIIKKILKSGFKSDRKMKLLVTAPSNAAVDQLMLNILQERDNFSKESGGKKLNSVRVLSVPSLHSKINDLSLNTLAKRNLKIDAKRLESSLLSSTKEELKSLRSSIASLEKKTCSGNNENLIAIEEEIRKKKYQENYLLKQSCVHKSYKVDDVHKKRGEILIHANIICTTLSGSGQSMIKDLVQRKKLKFDCIIVDEASQAKELECLIPLQYGCTKLILVGDPEQLPATVLSNEATRLNFGLSLFERLYNYFTDITKCPVNPVQMLTVQYRMHTEICRFPSTHVYGGRVITDKDVAERRRNFRLVPYLIFDVTDSREANNGKGEIFNEREASVVMAMIKTILSVGVNPNRIGVIVPYQTQKALIKRKISAEIEVNTVDNYQGREQDVMILSCVRAGTRGVGFLANRKRLNVALTRAKYSLFVIGNLTTLMTEKDWASLISDGEKRQLVVSLTKANQERALRKCIKRT